VDSEFHYIYMSYWCGRYCVGNLTRKCTHQKIGRMVLNLQMKK